MRSVGTLTRADLAETINRKLGLSRAESLDMVEAILEKMCGALSGSETLSDNCLVKLELRLVVVTGVTAPPVPVPPVPVPPTTPPPPPKLGWPKIF